MVDESTKEKTQGKWNQFKGKVREKWGKLTNDELDQMKGRREQMVGRIQERHGEARENVERDVDRFSQQTGYRFD